MVSVSASLCWNPGRVQVKAADCGPRQAYKWDVAIFSCFFIFVWFVFSIELHQPVVLLCIALHLHMTRSSRCAKDRVTGCKYCCRVSSLQTCFGGEVETMERKLFMCNIIQIEVCGGGFFLGGGQKSMQIWFGLNCPLIVSSTVRYRAVLVIYCILDRLLHIHPHIKVAFVKW